MVPGPGPPPKTKRIIALIDYEPEAEHPERTEHHVVSAHKAACRNLRPGTSAVISLYDDETGDFLGSDISGKPSPTIQKAYEEFVDTIRGVQRTAS